MKDTIDYPNEQICRETELMQQALNEANEEFKKRFLNFHEDILNEAWQKFTYFIESDTSYVFQSWIRQTVDEILIILLSGENKYLKHSHIISDKYDCEKLRKVRIAILKSNSGEIENTVIRDLEAQVEVLKQEIKHLREWR